MAFFKQHIVRLRLAPSKAMAIFKRYIIRLALSKAMKRRAQEPVPRSGEEGKRVNSFSVALRHPEIDGFSVLIDALTPHGAQGLYLSGEKHEMPCCISNVHFSECKLFASRFYGRYTFEYHSAVALIVSESIRRPFFAVASDRLSQLSFNLRTPVRFERMQLLKSAVEHYLEIKTSSALIHKGDEATRSMTSSYFLMRIHGMQMYQHPQFKQHDDKMKLYLRSLVVSGDMFEDQQRQFRIKPQAIQTIAKFEQENRRHRTQVTQTWLLVIFTGLLAFFGAAPYWVKIKALVCCLAKLGHAYWLRALQYCC